MSRSKVVVVPGPSFDEAAAAVMNELRGALVELVGGLPVPIARAVDLERSLKLDKKLAWQVFRLTQSASPAEAANVPARASVRRLLAAARTHRVPKSAIDRVSRAFERFEAFAEAHGGDREGLMSMVAGLSGENSEPFELKVRKAAFRANAHIWGAQAHMQARSLIQRVRSESPWVEDCILISGDIGLQRLRQNDPLVMLRWWSITDVPAEPEGGPRAPGPLAGVVGQPVKLLADFSTRPLPRMVSTPGSDGSVETELVIPAGRTGAVTLYSSQFLENTVQGPQGSYYGRMFVTIPVETAVWELLVPAGLTDPSTVRAVVYGRRTHPEQVYEMRPGDLLAQQGSATYLGAMESVPPMDGAPGHADAVQQVLAAQGWSGMRFDVYRCRVRYPVLHTLVCLFVDAKRR